MRFLIKLYVYAQSMTETISVRLSRPTMAAGRTIEFKNWGCGL